MTKHSVISLFKHLNTDNLDPRICYTLWDEIKHGECFNYGALSLVIDVAKYISEFWVQGSDYVDLCLS